MCGSRIPDVCVTPAGPGTCNHNHSNNTSGGASSNHENHSSGPGVSYGGNGAPGQPRPIDAVIERSKNPISITETNVEPVVSAADDLIKKSVGGSGNTEETSVSVSLLKNAALIALGIAFLPEEIVAGASMALTALTIGPVTEGMTIELLANSAFMQAATRAGAVLGGKYLNIFGVFSSAGLTTKTFVEHPCKGMTAAQVIQKTIGLGVETLRDKLLLWSGLGEDYGVMISQEFALKNGYTTLEMTPGGKWLHEVGLFENNSPFTKQEAYDIWEAVSMDAMKKASGKVQAVVGIVSARSIYVKEIAELVKNPNVVGDVIEFEVKPRVIFKNGR